MAGARGHAWWFATCSPPRPEFPPSSRFLASGTLARRIRSLTIIVVYPHQKLLPITSIRVISCASGRVVAQVISRAGNHWKSVCGSLCANLTCQLAAMAA